MNEADIHLACRSLRDQHGKMTEKEKKLRSSLDFQTAQHIMITLGRLGLAKEKLVEMNTGLTKVLGEFLDLESIRHGQIKQNNQNFYHRIENPRNATGEHVAQASSTDEHSKDTNPSWQVLYLIGQRFADERRRIRLYVRAGKQPWFQSHVKWSSDAASQSQLFFLSVYSRSTRFTSLTNATERRYD